MVERQEPPPPRNYTVRFYHPGDEGAIVELVRSVFPFHEDLDVEQWRWLNKDNPIGESVVVVAESAGTIIGCEYNVRLEVKVGNRTLDAVYGAMDVVHPDFRDMGVYREIAKLRDVAQRDIPLSFWLTTSPIMVKDSLRVGSLYFPHTLLEFTKIVDLALHLKRNRSPKELLRTGGYLARRALGALESFITRRPPAPPSLRIREITGFDERVDAFWREIRERYTFAIERSRAYLNWRYCDPRSGHHVVTVAEEGGRMVGFSVVDTLPDPDEHTRKGRVIDLLTLPDRLDVADALVEEALGELARRKTHTITCLMVGKHPHAKILERHGFVPMGERSSLFLRPRLPGIKEEIEKLARSSPEGVHVCHGDFP